MFIREEVKMFKKVLFCIGSCALTLMLCSYCGNVPISTEEPGIIILAKSTFDQNDEGWLVIGDAGPTPGYHDTGGSSGEGDGYISTTDRQSGIAWFWEAPSKFLGNQEQAYGGTLSFDLMQDTSELQSNTTNDVRLLGKIGEASTTLVYNIVNNPGTDWTSYTITLTADSDWYKEIFEGEVPTKSEMREVLSTLEHIYIRGEFSREKDTGSLDSVFLCSGS